MGYGPYNKRFEFGPNMSKDELRAKAAHEDALQIILSGDFPWLDVYRGELKREMAGEFLGSLMLPEMTEQEVATSYVNGTYDIDKLLHHVLAEAREKQALEGNAAGQAVRLSASVREYEQTGYLEIAVVPAQTGRSFG